MQNCNYICVKIGIFHCKPSVSFNWGAEYTFTFGAKSFLCPVFDLKFVVHTEPDIFFSFLTWRKRKSLNRSWPMFFFRFFFCDCFHKLRHCACVVLALTEQNKPLLVELLIEKCMIFFFLSLSFFQTKFAVAGRQLTYVTHEFALHKQYANFPGSC